MKRQFNFGPIYSRMLKVIDSCITQSQLVVAKRYVDVGHEYIKKQIKKDGYLEHPTELFNAIGIKEELYDRILLRIEYLGREVKE